MCVCVQVIQTFVFMCTCVCAHMCVMCKWPIQVNLKPRLGLSTRSAIRAVAIRWLIKQQQQTQQQ